MYLLTIYFKGPRTEWAGKVCPQETIVSMPLPLICLARIKRKQLMRDMVADNVGYVITDSSGAVVEPLPERPDPAQPKRSTILNWPSHLKD